MKRRDFLSGLAVTSATLAAGQAGKSSSAQPQAQGRAGASGPPKNIMICAANGIPSRASHIDAGYRRLVAGDDTLDAAITTVSGPENDQRDTSVGLGGLPNEEGVVE